MALEIPTLDELVAQAIDDIDTTSPELFASIPRTPMNVFATATAGLVKGLYGYVSFLSRQSLPTEAVGYWLARWGRFFGIPARPATKAAPVVSVVSSASGSISKGIIFRRGDGFQYAVAEDTTFTAGTATIALEATVAGVTGSVAEDTILTLTETVAGLARTGTVVDDVEGEAAENDEAYRVRILARTRSVPQGGAAADYIAWALAVPGVGKAWVIPSTSPYVDVRIISNDVDVPAPTGGLIDAVQAYIDERRPVTAIPVVAAAALFTQVVTLTALTPNTSTVQNNVRAALQSFYRSSSIQNPGVTVYDTAVIAAIQDAEGVVTFTKSAPTGDNNYGAAGFPVLGTVTIP